MNKKVLGALAVVAVFLMAAAPFPDLLVPIPTPAGTVVDASTLNADVVGSIGSIIAIFGGVAILLLPLAFVYGRRVLTFLRNAFRM